jgi:hypothetical protein
LLYQVATGILSPENAAFNLRDVFLHRESGLLKRSALAECQRRTKCPRQVKLKLFAY